MKIVDAPEDFAREVLALYDDTETAEKMSRDALQYIRQHNSVDAAWNVIRGDFENTRKRI
jgi:hypothetical protein